MAKKSLTYLAAYYYNDDYGSIMRIMEVLSLAVDPTYYNFYEEADAHCVRRSDLTNKVKDARKALLSKRKKLIR